MTQITLSTMEARSILEVPIEAHVGSALMSDLTKRSPAWLRSQLVEPDPVYLHDWNLTPTQYKILIHEALRVVT